MYGVCIFPAIFSASDVLIGLYFLFVHFSATQTAKTRREAFKSSAPVVPNKGTVAVKTFANVRKETTEAAADPLNNNVIKALDNGHSLVLLKRTRVKGFCVECIKKKSDPNYKKTMTKIVTYCPTCPGGTWICEPCFDEKHQNI